MCRIQICMNKDDKQDADAFIGYDQPLRTFFLQGFLKDYGEYEDFEIWLGTELEEFPALLQKMQLPRKAPRSLQSSGLTK